LKDRAFRKKAFPGTKGTLPFEAGGSLYEYHWYEHRGIGRVKLKQKLVDER